MMFVSDITASSTAIVAKIDRRAMSAITPIEWSRLPTSSSKQKRFTMRNAGLVLLALATTASAQYTSGINAVARGWLYVGLPVDVGTTANEVSLIDGELITAVGTVADPKITVTTSVSTTAGTHFVSLKNARSGTSSSR